MFRQSGHFPMKYFGTVKSFDEKTGHGFIIPETGGEALRFAQGTGSWTHVAPPRAGQRLSYDVHHTNGMPNAVNLATI
jgi:cold shock CspA family protein